MSPTIDDHVPNVRSDCAWVAAAPLGCPVVPDVKMRSETSSGCYGGGACRRLGRIDTLASPEERAQFRHWHRAGAVGAGPVVVAQKDDAGQVGGVLSGQQGRVVGAQEAADGHERRDSGVANDVRRLPALEARVQGHQHSTGPQEPECRQHPFGAIGRPHGHAVPGTEPGGQEAAGVAVDLLGQLRVGEAQRPVDQRLRAAVTPRRVVDQAGHRAPDEVRPRVFLVGRSAADAAAHGCWLLTEMTSPER